MVSKALADNLAAAQDCLGSAMDFLEAIDEPSEHVKRALRAMDDAARQLRIERSYRRANEEVP